VNADDHLLAGAYALGALDPAERQAFEAHLQACAACRTEVAGLTEAAARLAVATPAPVSQPLFDRVMTQVRATPQLPPLVRPGAERDGRPSGGEREDRAIEPTVVPDPIPSPAPINGTTIPRRRPPARPAPRGGHRWQWLGAAAAVVALAVLAGAVAARLSGERARQDEMAAIVTDPAAGHHTLAGEGPGEVRVHVGPGRRAVVEARHLPAVDPSKTYELWFLAGGSPYRATTFSPDATGAADLVFTAPVTDPDAFGVTVEPAGGSDVPTLPIVLQAST
jgi:anti-sigma-K factor RskA